MIAATRRLMAAHEGGHTTDDEALDRLEILYHRRGWMPLISQWQRAARERLCPICTEALALHDGKQGLYLECRNGHQTFYIMDCPLESWIKMLEAKGEVVRDPVVNGQRSVAQDMRDLYG